MKKLFGAIVAFALLAFNFNVQASDTQNPYALANEVATKTISDIKANKDKLTDKAFANELIEKDLMPYIDSKYAAYKVMGTSLKTISAQDREKFTAAFTDYMKQNMVGVLTKYTNQDIVPSEVKDVDDKTNLVSVKLFIREEGKKDLELILKLRKNNKTGVWKAFDLIGENISMLDAKISEISPIIKAQGVDAAIAKLQEGDSNK
ncbi:MAG: ABC transporter substrate-binding protein [Succinatimonas sp.]|jgi:phospholipid transport system substrate-binding protein|nr:ABC transporter substrate-binding protein [Succinatimonas sp.]MDD5868927.1 ABC transporter substrate-binding protein [Succinatimonas sp.]MDY5722665.1 ABC transporter substrate-binding protein [Succinivibrio sp.]